MFATHRFEVYCAASLACLTLAVEARAQVGNNNANLNNTGGTVFFARVDPTGISTGTGGGGISGVTQTNLTQNTAAIARNFFAAGGIAIDPQPVGLNQVAATTASSSPALANNAAKGFIQYRSQLMDERLRLVQLIDRKRRERRPAAMETTRVIAIERAIQLANRQIAAHGIKAPAKATPASLR
jgi:hypothetical protein